MDRDALIPIAADLTAADFYVPSHQRIYAAMLALYSRRVPPDAQTVAEELRRTNELETVGGFGGLMELAYVVPTALHVQYYAQIVMDCSLARSVIEAGRDIAAAGYDGEDRATLIARAEERLKRSTLRAATSDFVWMGEAMNAFLEQLGTGGAKRTSTGIMGLDRQLVGGLMQDALYTVAARPGAGKTWIACQLAYTVARRGGLVVFYSFEMKRDQLMARFQSLATGIRLDRVLTPAELTTEELQRISQAAAAMEGYRLALRDDFGLALEGVIGGAVGLQAEHGAIDLLIVDYLQLTTTGTKRREPNRVQEVSEISRGLKKLAGTLACPVLALSQLNRGIEGRQDSTPRLSDLRESGSIEQDSDAVLFLQRDDKMENTTNVIIAKQRNGPSDVTVKLFHDPTCGRWGDLETFHAVQGYEHA
jgi:replicative DNA helicase